MGWFVVCGAVPQLPDGLDAEQEKQWRLSLLGTEEWRAFEWFRLGYTARWTAETMMLSRGAARRLFSGVFCKLNAADEAEVCRLYRETALKPQDFLEEERNM
ncbi:hypothetical protein SDC9_64321 [bioreactor metagenome]|uniref:HTH luxR-type domain-containing protein n=1 Tax=bioreactor metagenome TaxID=1076179 RepID=A0A644XQ73_9ZZZZ|nr:hypothetical protein [Oscillibacter sp.]